ncbi:30S ribosomal protein S4 [Candidatus Kaiserbacteria bacterium]|nr:30S ribosomal protein S4 [Candidatus Kaiserbacteria bacterium]
MLRVRSKFKVAKRLGAGVYEKTQSQKFVLSEARTAKVKKGRGRGLSDYGKQMLEKQKVRYTYGLTEHQFRRYINEAMKVIDSPAAIHAALELRLDSIVYRAGLAPTRSAARQMVSHGHITVNGRRDNTPSRRMHVGDTFSVREGSKRSALFAPKEEGVGMATPTWLEFDRSTLMGKVLAVPSYTAGIAGFDYPTVFEFYSR